jgi:hypothetical protein
MEGNIMQKKDISGKKFGRLTAKKYYRKSGRTYWNCICECGNTKRVGLTNLISGKTKSCGCLHRDSMRAMALDLTGKKFGLLTVIKRNEERSVAKKIVWECLCECGKTTLTQTNNLRSGNSSSCRSPVHWAISENNIRLYRARYIHYQSGARRRGLKFELTIEEFKNLVDKPCYYCGTESSYRIRRVNTIARNKMINGIDRIDSKKDYSIINCIPCCTRCNEMKNDSSYDEFLKKVFSIAHHLNLR